MTYNFINVNDYFLIDYIMMKTIHIVPNKKFSLPRIHLFSPDHYVNNLYWS